MHTGGDHAASTFRVLPSSPSDPASVDPTSVPYLRVDRQLAAYQDDLLLTMRNAPNVTAILRPDLPGTYMVLVTVIDACNSTAQVTTNVTALCQYAPVVAVSNRTRGDQPWNQRAAMDQVSETHAFGWWPAHALDGSPTRLRETDERYYYAYKSSYDATISGEAVFGDESSAPESSAPVTIINDGSPQPPAPPPPSSRPLSALDEWAIWNSAPDWDVPHRPDDGLLYEWTLTSAPSGSNAWRRLFRSGNETANVATRDVDGFAYLHSLAPEDGPTPHVSDPRHFLASFTPDAVGTYGFRLDVSNVCHAATIRFETSFVCNAAPQPRISVRTRDVGLCLARQEVTSAANDTDGDEVHVLWRSAGASNDTRAPAFVDGVPLGAGDASVGLLLSDYAGPITSFMPDVPGEYELQMTVTDGCLVAAARFPLTSSWSDRCEAARRSAATALTAGPALVLIAMLFFSFRVLRTTPTHPYDPATVREIATRLRRWEARKMRVKFDRLRDSWELRAHRDALRLAVQAHVHAKKTHSKSKATIKDGDPPSIATVAPATKQSTTRRAARAAHRAFAAAMLFAAGAVEEGASLVPPSVHAWRVGQVVAVIFEGVTLSSLAFGRNAAPWLGESIASVGRSLAGQFDAPWNYVAANGAAALVAAALVASQLARPERGRPSSLTRRLVRAAWRRATRSSSRGEGYVRRRRRDRFGFREGTAENEYENRTKERHKTVAAHAASAADRERASHFESDVSAIRLASRLASRLSRVLAFVSDALLYLIAEPLFVPVVASAASTLACNHVDVHRPFPHLARDDAFRCYGAAHLRLAALGVAAATLAPILAVDFLVSTAPRRDLTVRELPHFAIARVACRWFAAVMATARGESDLTRVRPRGAYGVPSDLTDGFAKNTRADADAAHSLSLILACAFLYLANFAFQPVRGRGGRMNESRGGAYAAATFVAFFGYVATRESKPPPAGVVDADAEIANATLLALFVPLFFYLGWTHTAARGASFAYPDMSPFEMRRDDDPRVRAMGVLVGDATDGLVGAFGHWEGLRRQAEDERLDRRRGASTRGMHHAPGRGFAGLTPEAIDDAADDAFAWQTTLQAHFAGCAVGAATRAHACEAIEAMAASPRGVMAAQRACLVPLLRRCLLDASSEFVRAAAARAAGAMAKSARGASLLCQSDADLFRACVYQRQREWYVALAFLERRYHRGAADSARVRYELGLGLTYASRWTPPDRFDALLDWNVRDWSHREREAAEAEANGKTLAASIRAMWRFIFQKMRPPENAEAAARSEAKRLRAERRRARRRAEALRATLAPEISIPEALARMLRDERDGVVVAAIRCVGSILAGLRAAGGVKMPHDAERGMRDRAKKIAGGFARLGGVLKDRNVPADDENADAALAATTDTRRRVRGRRGGDDAENIDDVDDASVASGSSYASRSSAGSRGFSSVAGSSRTGGGRLRDDDSDDEDAGIRKPSPMDHLLDTPGLLEGLVLCTAHPSSLVRSAAHEELQVAAAEDEVSTIAKRVLELLETGADAWGRVKALEYVNTLISGRFQDIIDAAVEVAPGSNLGGDPFDPFAREGSARDSVDLAAGWRAADPETPGVTTLLSQEGVAGVAKCLDDQHSAAVRVTALDLLGAMWELLAAEEVDPSGDRDSADEGRLALFRECGVVARLDALVAEDTDAEARRHAVDLAQRIKDTDPSAAAEFEASAARRVGDSLADQTAEFLESTRDRAEREATRSSVSGESPWGKSPGTYRSGDTYTERASAMGTPEGIVTPGGGGVSPGGGGVTPRTPGSDVGGDARRSGGSRSDRGSSYNSDREDADGVSSRYVVRSSRTGEETHRRGAARWDAYVREKAPPTVRYSRGRADPDAARARARRRLDEIRANRRAPGGVSSDGRGRWTALVATRDGVKTVRARFPKRSAPFAGAPLAPTRVDVGDPSGPGPDGPGLVREQRAARGGLVDDPDRPTWRERASEYILAGGGDGGAGGRRRGPHERGLLRDGRVGLAGQTDMPIQGPNDMFPENARAVGPHGGVRASGTRSRGTRRTERASDAGDGLFDGVDGSFDGVDGSFDPGVDGFDGFDWDGDEHARVDVYGYGDDRRGDAFDGFDVSDGDVGGFGAFRRGGDSARGFVGRGSRRGTRTRY